MPTRRNVLQGALLAAAGVPLVGMLSQQSAWADDRLSVTIVNDTGQYANSVIWAYVVGTNPAGQQCYVTAAGNAVPVSTSLNGSDGFADLSIPLSSSGGTALSLPNMSGRIYFSINDKLKFKVVTDGNGNGALQYPAGWVSTDPSYNVLHDNVEFTFNASGMFCNTTMVDMFSIPLALRLQGQSDQTTGTLTSGGRAAIFAGIAAQSDFSKLVVGNNLRVIAPGHGLESGLFSSTYYDSYVNDVWNHYASNDLTVAINSTTYTGRVNGGNLAFNNGVAAFAKPSTRDIFYCNGALSAPNDGKTGPVAAILGAAFNRSTLLSHSAQSVSDASQFYQTAPTNYYSKVIHANMVDGKAYGFPFDDVNSFASYVQDTAPSSLTITLTPFAGGSSSGGGGSSTGTLISQGKAALSSSNETNDLMSPNAVDGNSATRWSSAFTDPQWLQVDLGATHSVSRAVLTWEAAYGKAYQIQTSTDGSTWNTAYSTSSGDGGVDDVSFAAVNARYVRMYGTTRGTQYGYSLWEFAVYGS
jgi:hypothetical protein